MRIITKITISISIIFLLFSCEYGIKNGDELSIDEIEFIKNLGLLDEKESIIQFHSQSGESEKIKQAGNFYTDKRVAAYWIDRKNESERNVNSALYSQIDTMFLVDNTKDWFAGSYVQVKTLELRNFRVYVNGDSAAVWKFCEDAIKEWNKKATKN